ncbi:hypothetical protein ACFW16_28320 [Inquilinus sp. NPDC058860]|uniref:hypothetical protein n=1 Tax=Inquilinus sp. NPDC058860 TaxID=3346652 RepID=UPI003676F7E6
MRDLISIDFVPSAEREKQQNVSYNWNTSVMKFDYITRQNIHYSRYHETRNLFFQSLCAAEQHWFFVQGHDAYVHELYIPALSSLLNGLEASLRVTLHLLNQVPQEQDLRDISPYRVLSNKLILQAQEAGLPVKYLAFNEEMDFFENLKTEKPNRVDVGIVRLRNNICHGNVMDFVNVDLGPESSFFSPEMLKTVTEKVLAISADWCEALGQFRRRHGFRHYDAPDDRQVKRDLALYDYMYPGDTGEGNS